ncbi:MAG: twin-arginine translocase TatA/TatE family subunit [Acidimicrobiales bacterium]
MLALLNVNGSEYLIIAVVALVILGPEQLPSTLRRVGGYIRQFRDMGDQMRTEFLGYERARPNQLGRSRRGSGFPMRINRAPWLRQGVVRGGPTDRRIDQTASPDVVLADEGHSARPGRAN